MTRRTKALEVSRRILGFADADAVTGRELYEAFTGLARKSERIHRRRMVKLTRAFDRLLADTLATDPKPANHSPMNSEHYPTTGAPINPRHVLGVSADATHAQIDAAFYRMAAGANAGDGYSQSLYRLCAAREELLDESLTVDGL